ncbi:MAG TPA: enoyl-CoA hydratase/isomerase family protein [Vicinamibacterales bacterium]|nr:enoyl-CoA hydratase/isomerase family protein [Vicinamibacterales bacterium]
MTEGPVHVALNREGTRASLRLFHPKGNIITLEMVQALETALDALAEQPHLKLLTIEGAGDDFSFGASVPEHAPGAIDRALPAMHALIERLLAVPAVTAAIVRGRCLGGGFELALACDFVFAADAAVLGLPEVALGVFPPAASALLPVRIGAARATRAIVTGASRPASEWLDAGLVEFIAASDSLDAEVTRWFDLHLAPRSATALRYAAAAARLGLAAHVRGVLPELERLYLKDLMQTADAAEGIAAFLDKRPPRWTDR